MHVHRQTLQHVFVVVADGASLQDPGTARVLDLPLVSKKEGSLYVPQLGGNSVIDACNATAMGAGYLSVHRADAVPSNRVSGLLELAHLRKQGTL
jgi:hypothetical protein